MKMPLVYSSEVFNNFVKRMTKAGIPVRHYRGRFFWEGPCVHTDMINGLTLEDIQKKAKMKLQHDGMGKYDLVVYPVGSGKLLENNQLEGQNEG
jgi:hypothetical protein